MYALVVYLDMSWYLTYSCETCPPRNFCAPLFYVDRKGNFCLKISQRNKSGQQLSMTGRWSEDSDAYTPVLKPFKSRKRFPERPWKFQAVLKKRSLTPSWWRRREINTCPMFTSGHERTPFCTIFCVRKNS